MKSNLRLLVVLGFFMTLPGLSSFSQVLISGENSTADASAMLEVRSDNKGFLPPRIELTAVNSASPIVSPAIGLLVYNTALAGISPNNVIPGFYYWNGEMWISFSPPRGASIGDMLYWDGEQWVAVTTGLPGQFLQLSLSGIPRWSGDAYASLNTVAVSSITTITATSGGNISSDGGTEVTARGVCWGTSPNPDISGSHSSDGIGTGTFVSNLTGLIPGTSYYVRAYATNNVGTAYGDEISFTTSFAVGQNYGGGIIFYVDGSGQHGLIASTVDQSAGMTWFNGEFIVTGATATEIGSGNANTTTITAAQGSGEYAAKVCEDLVINGFSDWYLPSKDELNAMYLNLKVEGLSNFVNDYYFSSSEFGLYVVWCQNFTNGDQPYLYKHSSYHVRAARAF